MKLSHLLHQREALLKQTRLANLAYAYRRLADFAGRIARARLGGTVCLSEYSMPDLECYWPGLKALEGSQAVIEEHFTDEDIVELAGLVAYATDNTGAEVIFRLEELETRFIHPLRRQLMQAGIALEQETPPIGESKARG